MSDVTGFSADELAAAVFGSWRGRGCPVSGVFTDTRVNGEGKLFVALAGERFDAHDFLDRAVASGAAALLVRRDRAVTDGFPVPLLEVADTLTAYQALAAFHRRRFPGLRVAGVTGSVGKTSVKEMLRAICRKAAGDEAMVLATEGNTNNQVGVPQNLLRLDGRCRFAVIEMGTSSPGEILPLSLCAAPDVAVVNSIAPCHVERLGDLEGVAREKGTIFAGVPADGVAVVPGECPQRRTLERAAGRRRVITFGFGPGCDVRVGEVSGTLSESVFSLDFPDRRSFTVRWPLAGRHQVGNAAAAAAAAYALGIAPEEIAAGLPETRLPGMRMKTSVIDGVTYINDAYNANPGSMAAALRLLAGNIDPRRLVLLLGGMRELGEISEREHRKLLADAEALLPGVKIITVGAEFAAAAGAAGVEYFSDAAAAAGRVAEIVSPGDTIFAKGSRFHAVEGALPPSAR